MIEKVKKFYDDYHNFVLILVIGFFIYSCNQSIGTTLPKYANYLGASASWIGAISGSYGMSALLLRPISGQIVDNYNKKKLLTISFSIIFCSALGLIFANKVYQLFLLRCLNGIGWGIGSTLCMTIACSSVPAEKVNSAIGIYSIAQSTAQAVCPAISLFIANNYGYSKIYILSLVLVGIVLVLSLVIDLEFPEPEKRKIDYSFKGLVTKENLLPVSILFCNGLGRASITAFLVIFAESIGLMSVGFYFTIQSVMILVCKPVLSALSDRVGTNKVLIPCEILQIVGLLLIALTKNIFMVLVAAVCMGVGTSGSQPLLIGLCVKSVSKQNYGKASNSTYLAEDVANFLGSNICGIVDELFGHRIMFAICTVPIIVALGLYVKLLKNRIKIFG